jgi:hypothetical protein
LLRTSTQLPASGINRIAFLVPKADGEAVVF